MNRLNKAQRDKVKQFTQFTGTDDATALHYLQQYSFNVEQAADRYFSQPISFSRGNNGSAADSSSIQKMFEKYANDPEDELPGKIGPHGVVRLLTDLNVDPSDRSVLILAWKLKAERQCEFSKDEWVRGMENIRCDSISKLASWMKNSASQIQDPAAFRAFYTFTFTYAKSLAGRGLPLDIAVAYWRIIFGSNNSRVEHWIAFLEKQKRGVTKDEWALFLEFLNTVNADLSNYDSEGAWPVRIDEYVDYCKKEQNGEPMEN